MNRQELEAVIRRVVEQYQDNLTGSGDLSFPVEASANHVHLTREAVETLCGAGTELTCDRQLSQPGEFLSGQRLRLATAKGELGRVAVLGPERSAVQVEMSLTDLRRLGIKAPVNLSGNLNGAGDICLIGPQGAIWVKGCVIAARAHIHMRPEDAARFGVTDRQEVKVRVEGDRTVVFEHVIVRVSDRFALAMHIDFDEANACCLGKNSRGTIVP